MFVLERLQEHITTYLFKACSHPRAQISAYSPIIISIMLKKHNAWSQECQFQEETSAPSVLWAAFCPCSPQKGPKYKQQMGKQFVSVSFKLTASLYSQSFPWQQRQEIKELGHTAQPRIRPLLSNYSNQIITLSPKGVSRQGGKTQDTHTPRNSKEKIKRKDMNWRQLIICMIKQIRGKTLTHALRQCAISLWLEDITMTLSIIYNLLFQLGISTLNSSKLESTK